MINMVHSSWFKTVRSQALLMVHGKKKTTNYELPTTNQTGFSLAEILVVIAILGVVGVIITEIFVSSIRGGNKATVIANLKRNGQIAMETMDKNIRNAKAVICPYVASTGIAKVNSIVIQAQDDKYIRYKFTPSSPTVNGKIEVDNPQPTQAELDNIQSSNCTFAAATSLSNLTDTSTRTGVSISLDSGKQLITRDVKEGFVDIIAIEFKVAPAVLAPAAFAGQVDAENFQTTIELRR